MAPTHDATGERSGLWLTLFHRTLATLDLDANVPDDLALAAAIRRGLPAHTIDALIEHGIPEADVFGWVIPRRTWQRRRQAQETLTADESDRAERLARIFALACAVLDDQERAVLWLSSSKRRFDGQRPLDLISSSVGTKLVEEALLQAYYGNVA